MQINQTGAKRKGRSMVRIVSRRLENEIGRQCLPTSRLANHPTSIMRQASQIGVSFAVYSVKANSACIVRKRLPHLLGDSLKAILWPHVKPQ